MLDDFVTHGRERVHRAAEFFHGSRALLKVVRLRVRAFVERGDVLRQGVRTFFEDVGGVQVFLEDVADDAAELVGHLFDQTLRAFDFVDEVAVAVFVEDDADFLEVFAYAVANVFKEFRTGAHQGVDGRVFGAGHVVELDQAVFGVFDVVFQHFDDLGFLRGVFARVADAGVDGLRQLAEFVVRFQADGSRILDFVVEEAEELGQPVADFIQRAQFALDQENQDDGQGDDENHRIEDLQPQPGTTFGGKEFFARGKADHPVDVGFGLADGDGGYAAEVVVHVAVAFLVFFAEHLGEVQIVGAVVHHQLRVGGGDGVVVAIDEDDFPAFLLHAFNVFLHAAQEGFTGGDRHHAPANIDGGDKAGDELLGGDAGIGFGDGGLAFLLRLNPPASRGGIKTIAGFGFDVDRAVARLVEDNQVAIGIAGKEAVQRGVIQRVAQGAGDFFVVRQVDFLQVFRHFRHTTQRIPGVVLDVGDQRMEHLGAVFLHRVGDGALCVAHDGDREQQETDNDHDEEPVEDFEPYAVHDLLLSRQWHGSY